MVEYLDSSNLIFFSFGIHYMPLENAVAQKVSR